MWCAVSSCTWRVFRRQRLINTSAQGIATARTPLTLYRIGSARARAAFDARASHDESSMRARTGV
eukprot:6189070-Pleurochrysis_carterae.AAC.4